MKTDYVTAEELIEAIQACYGIIGSVIQYLQEHFNKKTYRRYLKERIKEWDLSELLDESRKNGVEKCLRTMFSKGIDEGSEKAMMWMLDRYGQHCDFLDEREESGLESSKGDISGYYEHIHSEYVREDSEAVSEADQEYSRE